MAEPMNKPSIPLRVWLLSSPESTRGLADWDESMYYIPAPPCPNEPERHKGIGSKRCEHLSLLLTQAPVRELTWTWSPSALIVRDDAMQLLQARGFTGYEVGPVTAHLKVRAKKPDPCDDNPGLRADEAVNVEIPRLWEFKVRGWGGVAPPESGIRLVKYCPGCGYRKYSGVSDIKRLFDSTQWDGSDFFMIWPLPNFIFVTERVAEFISSMKWRSYSLIPLEEMRTTGTGFSPGSLKQFLPDELARGIGEPLGIYA